MADKKITDLPDLTSADSGDYIPIVDISANVTKKIPASGLATAIPDGSIASAKLALSKTTDVNGWTVYNFGTFKKFHKRFSYGAVVGLNAGVRSNIVTATDLPAGKTTSTVFVSLTGIPNSNYGGHGIYGYQIHSTTQFGVWLGNGHTAVLSYDPGYVDVECWEM